MPGPVCQRAVCHTNHASTSAVQRLGYSSYKPRRHAGRSVTKPKAGLFVSPGRNSTSTPLTAERRDELDALHRAVEVKGISCRANVPPCGGSGLTGGSV